MSRSGVIAALLVSTLPMTACVSGSARDLDTRFAAGWRPSKAYCAFGGATPTLGAWCAQVNFGPEGLLTLARAVNEDVLAQAAGDGLPCTRHVAIVRREMSSYPDYMVSDLYSCDAEPPIEAGRAVCHVSLLVSSAAGARVVMDNGYVLPPAATGGVALYPQFVARVDRHWVGQQPDWVALSGRGTDARGSAPVASP